MVCTKKVTFIIYNIYTFTQNYSHTDSHILSQTHTYTLRQVLALQQRLFNHLSLISRLLISIKDLANSLETARDERGRVNQV